MKLSIENRARLLFMLVILIGAATAGAWYYQNTSRSVTYQLRTQDSVSGLIVDAPVELHGVEVGKVEQIKLADAHTVDILIRVRKDIPLTRATTATITSRGVATRGFTGYVYISLEDSGSDTTPLISEAGESYPQIKTAPSRSVSLDTAISQVNENFQALTDLLRNTLDRQTLTSFKLAVDNLQRVTGMLEANNQRLISIIVNAEQASGRLDPLLQSGSETLRILQQQVLPEAYRALDKVDRLSTSLNNFSDKLNRDPSILVRGTTPPPPGPGEKQ